MKPTHIACERHMPNVTFDGCPSPYEWVYDGGFCIPCRAELTEIFDRKLALIEAAIDERKRMLENSTQEDYVLAP